MPAFPFEVYAFGRAHPLRSEDAIPAVMGGLVKILPVGGCVAWATTIEERLSRPEDWDPDVPHPGHRGRAHVAFQSEDAQRIHPMQRHEDFTPLDVAAGLFDRARDQIWVRAPTCRPLGLYWKGRRVHSIIAVVELEQYPRRSTAL